VGVPVIIIAILGVMITTTDPVYSEIIIDLRQKHIVVQEEEGNPEQGGNRF
jgi:hypothetical protein